MDNMDIDIVIKGGMKLESISPKKYDAFEQKLMKMMLALEGVGSCCITNARTMGTQTQAKKIMASDRELVKQILIELAKEDPGLFRGRAAPVGN